MGAGGAEGRMSKGSAGRGVEGRPEGTGASKSSPSSLISSAATGRAVPEPDRNRRGQARERPDPTAPQAPQAPPNQPRELAPRGEISLGSQTPESSQLAWTADPLWKVAGPEKHRGCGCGRGSKWGHGGKPSGPADSKQRTAHLRWAELWGSWPADPGSSARCGEGHSPI